MSSSIEQSRDSQRVDDNPRVDDNKLSRNAFLQLTVGCAGAAYVAALGYPLYRYLNSPAEKAAQETAVTEVTLKGVQKMAAGSVQMFKFGAVPSMLIHHADGTWTALDAVCTHLGCTVEYHPDKKQIICACHGGVYDPKTGGNVAGPPPKPLRRYEVKFVGDDAIVSKG